MTRSELFTSVSPKGIITLDYQDKCKIIMSTEASKMSTDAMRKEEMFFSYNCM